jgi:hypothetical protein
MHKVTHVPVEDSDYTQAGREKLAPFIVFSKARPTQVAREAALIFNVRRRPRSSSESTIVSGYHTTRKGEAVLANPNPIHCLY